MIRPAALLLALLLPLAAAAEDRPLVVAVNYPLAYFAERLGGEAIEVLYPVPEGRDPAFWKPAIADIMRIQGAALILLNGAGFAEWTTKASLPRARIVDTSKAFSGAYISTETVTHSHGAEGTHSHTGTASYTWLDPAQARAQADAVARALVAKGLVDVAALAPRQSALEADLAALSEAGGALSAAGAGQAILATHPRYHYLARAFGLTIEALDWEPGAAPDSAQLADLAGRVEAGGASVLIWEAEVPEEARAAVRALGLTDAVVPTLARPPRGTDFVSAYRQGLAELTQALDSVSNRSGRHQD